MNIAEPIRSLAVPIAELSPYRSNPRQGDVGAIVSSLEANGQYRPIVVNRRTGEVLAGNHTLAAARALGWSSIAATFVDVDDDEAARIVLVDNRSNDLAAYDEPALVAMLATLADDDPDALFGTGFDGDDLDDLLADAASPLDDDDLAGRKLVCDYAPERFRWLMRSLDRLRVHPEETNADVVARLVADAVGTPV